MNLKESQTKNEQSKKKGGEKMNKTTKVSNLRKINIDSNINELISLIEELGDVVEKINNFNFEITQKITYLDDIEVGVRSVETTEE